MKLFLTGIVVAAALLIAPSYAEAISFKTGEVVRVEKDTTHDGTLVAAGEAVEIHGTVDGDLICAAGKVRIYGIINGDLICASQSISIDGRVGGNVRSAGQSFHLAGGVDRNVIFLGQNLFTTGGSQIGGELMSAGQTMRVDGTVGKDLWFAGQDAELAGVVGRNLDVMGESLQVASTAQVQGKSSFTSENSPQVASGAAIAGGIAQRKPPTKPAQNEKKETAREQGSGLFYSILSVFIVGLLVSLLMPKKSNDVLDTLADHPLSSLGWGAAVMILGPTLALFLFVTIIGIPGGLLVLLLWALILMVGVVFFAMYIGDKILDTFVKDYSRSLLWTLVIGVPFTMLLFQIPVAGKLLMLVALWMGMGALFQSFKPPSHHQEKERSKKSN
jgi:hypothetical protein